MRRFLFFAVLFIVFPSLCFASRGISLNIKHDGKTQTVSLYKASYALLIGVADYTNGWPDLTSIPREMKELEAALSAQGFTVVKVLNPDSRMLADAFENFIDKYGFDPENRLLFFYSGHGYSRPEVEKGYIVPADAPSPLTDKRGFVRSAIEMEQVVTWARRIESKHALFLFDSCFSGTVFQSRALPQSPPHITAMVARPVRQFISAGSAGEEVPSRSYFTPSFIRALEGEGDLDNDGYVTGTELGLYLNRKITNYRIGQTPQFGKIRDPRLDQGDFVFAATRPLSEKVAKQVVKMQPAPNVSPQERKEKDVTKARPSQGQTVEEIGLRFVDGGPESPKPSCLDDIWKPVAGKKYKIGVLLPMTGLYKAFGDLTKKGVDLAVARQDLVSERISVVYIDSGSDDALVKSAVEKLLKDKDVVALVGPLSKKKAASIASVASYEKIPVWALSTLDNDTLVPHMFGGSLGPKREARALARFAAQTRGLRRVAVMYPDSRYGSEIANAFAVEVGLSGGDVVAKISYAPELTDFRDPIGRLKEVEFDGLFLPDHADRISLLAPQLAYYGMPDAQLLGLSSWDSLDLESGGSWVNGAVFAKQFLLSSTDPVTNNFISVYRAKYGDDPTELAALGYDAISLLGQMIASYPQIDREGLSDALSHMPACRGVTSVPTFAQKGRVDKPYFVQVHGR